MFHFFGTSARYSLPFTLISAMTNYRAAAAFATLISGGIPLWDPHVSAETNVEDTLWLVYWIIKVVADHGAGRVSVCTDRGRETEYRAAHRRAAGCRSKGYSPFYLEGRPGGRGNSRATSRGWHARGVDGCDVSCSDPPTHRSYR